MFQELPEEGAETLEKIWVDMGEDMFRMNVGTSSPTIMGHLKMSEGKTCIANKDLTMK